MARTPRPRICGFSVLSLTLAAVLVVSCGDGEAGPGGGSGGSENGGPSKVVAGEPVDVETFLAHVRGLRQEAEDRGVSAIRGADADLLFVNELKALTTGPFWGEHVPKVGTKTSTRDPLPAILDVHRQLQALDIRWVFVPVPAKVAVDPSRVPESPGVPDGRIDVEQQRFFAVLREHGVPVLDLHPTLKALVAAGKRAHCATDTHWSAEACVAVAKQIRAHVGEEAWLAGIESEEFRTSRKDIQIDGDMVAMLEDGAKVGRESLQIAQVRNPAGALPANDKSSPILLMGDSHTLVFHAGADMHATGSGLADHLAAEFGTAVDLVGVRGSGATPSRVNVLRGGRLAGKKLVIWCLTMRELSDSEWSVIPLKPR